MIISARMPDVVFFNDKEDENTIKYQNLIIDIEKHVMQKRKLYQSSGITGRNFDELRETSSEYSGKHNSLALIKSALVGISKILRRVLDLYVVW